MVFLDPLLLEVAVEGTPFGRYRLLELLGRGGMGEVWRAYDTATDRIVAVKLLPAHFSQDPSFQQRFRREAHAAARLNNRHVIPIHNYGEIDGQLYVDMRLIEGRDLQAVLEDGPLEPSRAVRIIEQVANALHAAHKVGLMHRDVKPSNILLEEDDFAYLIDFGIARAANETGLTGTGGVIGSWHYMAPERFRAGEVDSRSDVYSLACVLCECLTGQQPYPGDSLEQQYGGHVVSPPPIPSRTNSDVPTEFDAVIAQGMAKEPDQRYPTTVELARASRDAVTVPIPRPAPRPMPDLSTERVQHRVTAPTVRSEQPPPAPQPDTVRSAPPQPQAFPNVPTQQKEPFAHPAPSTSAPPDGRGSRRKGWIITAAVNLVIIAMAVAVIVIVTRNQDTAQSTQTTQTQTTPTQTTLPTTTAPATTAPATPATPDERLLALVPKDLTCTSAPVLATSSAKNAVAHASCSGPNRLGVEYYLYADRATMESDFPRSTPGDTSSGVTFVACPGLGQSPLQWHRRATPQQPEGTLICADTLVGSGLSWTVDSQLVYAWTTFADLDTSFQWWTAHYQ